MKSTILLIACFLCCLAPAMAQLSEAEPNDTYTAANALPLNTTISGVTCNITPGGSDWFRIVLPADGFLKISCAVSSNIASPPPQSLAFQLFSKTNVPWNSFAPQLGGNGVAVTDSFIYGNLAADTFYIQVSNGIASATNVCFSYSFSCSLTPATFANDAEPDNYPAHPIPLAYNTPTQGHLGFHTQPVSSNDGDDYYTIVTPADGVLRVITETEAYTPGTNTMNVTVYNRTDVPLFSQNASPGAFQQAHIDTLYWQCIRKDTFHIRLETNTIFNGGYAYRLRYDVLPPVFAADAEPNGTYATAQVVNPNNNIEGHHFFYSATDNDYYKFYKPDTGFLKIYMKGETWGDAANQTYLVRLETKNQGYIVNASPRIGSYAQPSFDSIVIASLPADSFYISVQNSAYNQPCISYQLKIRSSGITGLAVPAIVNPEFSIYPNPSKGSFAITSSIHVPAATVRVYNIYGQTVFSQSMELPTKRDVLLPDTAPGIYNVEITAAGMRHLQKLLVQ